MSNQPKILITGADGQVGFELTRTLAPLGEVIALTRADLDLTDLDSIPQILSQFQPDIIVNSAAYTAVDKAESEIETAYAVNELAVKMMASWAQAHGAILFHYSTDYVFDGMQSTPYKESDSIKPQSVYGVSKAQGEQWVRELCPTHFIFRTSWVFGAYGGNFLKTMLHLMQTREKLNVVKDQVGAPTSAFLLADVTAHIVRDAWLKKVCGEPHHYGTYHLTASGSTSWHGYAQYIASLAEQAGVILTVKAEQIGAIASTEYPTPAARPANSRLNTDLLQSTFGLRLPDWHDGVRHAFKLIKQNT